VEWIGRAAARHSAEVAARHQGYPDGVRQIQRGAPNPPLQSLLNQCFSPTFEQLFLKKNHEK